MNFLFVPSFFSPFRLTDTKKGLVVKKIDRDKKKVKDSIIKKLRELEAEGRL